MPDVQGRQVKESGRSGRVVRRFILRPVGYFVVFLLLTWVLTLVGGFVLGVAVGLRLLQEAQGQQLLDSGWPQRIAALMAIAILVWHWLRHR